LTEELLFRVLTGRATDAERDVVTAWRSASAENAGHYAELEQALADVAGWYGSVTLPSPPSVDALLRQADLRRSGVERPAVGRGMGRWRWVALSAAAAALVAIGFGTARVVHRPAAPALAAVEFGGAESGLSPVTLSDGTTIRLGPKSHLRVEPHRDVREVWLDGRAEFSVAKVAGRPFRVRTSAGEARDLGTRFVIRTDGGGMQVAVFEGRVAFAANGASIDLEAGDVGSAGAGERPQLTRRGELHSSTDWLRAAVIFEGMTLEQVGAAIERRYHYQVRITDPALGQRTVSAWFNEPPAPRDAITAICRAVGATCSVTDSLAIVSAR
jgi:ferric-dicitrate binding protein FerR (iron transport regulator)